MQPEKSSRTTFVLLIFLHFLASQISSLDTIKQGDKLNSSSQLISAKGTFTLGFYTPQNTNNSYLAIWYTASSRGPVWIGNRERPIPNTMNPLLTLSTRGGLIITRSGGESFELYAAESNKNLSLSATLLDTGNFVLSSNGEILWQSFDHPTDTLLPGMKLGVNHRTGKNWTLLSWFGQRNPASGAFTLEWDPTVRNLIVKRRGMVYWTSGELKDYYFESANSRVKLFENFPREVDNHNLSNVTSASEEYFTYSLIIDPTWTHDERKIISGWKIISDGDIHNTDRGTIVRSSLRYGYKTEGSSDQKGCTLWAQPKCRNNR